MVGMEVGADDAGDARIAQRAGIERLPRVRAEGQADAGVDDRDAVPAVSGRSEEHTSELQSLMRISYAVFCLKKKNIQNRNTTATTALNKMYHKIILCTV